jgi:hypothetical protein
MLNSGGGPTLTRFFRNNRKTLAVLHEWERAVSSRERHFTSIRKVCHGAAPRTKNTPSMREFARRGQPDRACRPIMSRSDMQNRRILERPTRPDARKIWIYEDFVSTDREAKPPSIVAYDAHAVWSGHSVTLRGMTWTLGLGLLRALVANPPPRAADWQPTELWDTSLDCSLRDRCCRCWSKRGSS